MATFCSHLQKCPIPNCSCLVAAKSSSVLAMSSPPVVTKVPTACSPRPMVAYLSSHLPTSCQVHTRAPGHSRSTYF